MTTTKDPAEDLLNYEIDIHISKSLEVNGEPDWALDILRAEIRFDTNNHLTGEQPNWIVVGSIVLTVAREYRGETLFEMCDAHSQELHEAWHSLYNNDELRDEWADFGCGFIYIDDVRVEAEHRGKLLGLLALHRALDIVEHGCVAALIRAWPDGFRDMDKTQLKKEKEGLSKYFSSLGFVPFRDGFLALDIGKRRPTYDDLHTLKRSYRDDLPT